MLLTRLEKCGVQLMLTGTRYPTEVVITDGDIPDGTSTPAGEPDDDFFSSWDKPSIKKPTPPISRTATPPVVGRTPSPFLKPGENGPNRAASPLSKTDETSKPAAGRITHSSALKKSTTGAKKANVLGAKKVGSKLGAKKVVAAADIDFEEAERKAKEEEQRIKELGYNPDEEEAEAKKAVNEPSSIASPTPVSPPRGGYGAASHSREKSASEIERLGMGMGRLGFGQIGAAKKAAAAPQKGGGFGSVGPIKASAGMFSMVYFIASQVFLTVQQKMKSVSQEANSATRSLSHPTSSLARVHTTRMLRPKPRTDSKALRALSPSLPTPTLVVLTSRSQRSMAISRRPPRTLSESLVSRLVMTWRTFNRFLVRVLPNCKERSVATLEAERSKNSVEGSRSGVGCEQGVGVIFTQVNLHVTDMGNETGRQIWCCTARKSFAEQHQASLVEI